MKKIIFILFIAFYILGCGNKEEKDSYEETNFEEWKLKWADEFDGNKLNTDNWAFQVWPAGQFNNELQEYVKNEENCYVENGNMVIKAIKKGVGLNKGDFTSARMITYPMQKFKYGRIAARIKVPFGKGIWPAFWMLGANCSENPGGTVSWPQCGEIDIMEKIGGGDNEKKVVGTIHYWDERITDAWKWNYIPKEYYTGYNLSDDFHIYEIIWDEKSIIWKFDGIKYHEVDIKESVFDEFRKEFFIILNIAVGGNMPGNPDSSTIFPQYMYIDWVRVYERR